MAHEEPHIIAALIDLCQRHGVTCLMQIGAEDGYEAAQIASATNCQAIALDADYKCSPVEGVEWHHQMIGAYDGPADFYKNVMMGLSSAIQRNSSSGEEKVTRHQMRLDTFCRAHGIVPDALIVDVEGSTLDVLIGCGNLLDGVKVIYAEVHHDNSRGERAMAPEVDAYLTERGFTRSMALPTYCAGAQSNWSWVR